MVNEFPVPTRFPLVIASNQLMIPAEAVAPKVTVPVPHREAGVVPVIIGISFTVTNFETEFEQLLPFVNE